MGKGCRHSGRCSRRFLLSIFPSIHFCTSTCTLYTIMSTTFHSTYISTVTLSLVGPFFRGLKTKHTYIFTFCTHHVQTPTHHLSFPPIYLFPFATIYLSVDGTVPASLLSNWGILSHPHPMPTLQALRRKRHPRSTRDEKKQPPFLPSLSHDTPMLWIDSFVSIQPTTI